MALKLPSLSACLASSARSLAVAVSSVEPDVAFVLPDDAELFVVSFVAEVERVLLDDVVAKVVADSVDTVRFVADDDLLLSLLHAANVNAMTASAVVVCRFMMWSPRR